MDDRAALEVEHNEELLVRDHPELTAGEVLLGLERAVDLPDGAQVLGVSCVDDQHTGVRVPARGIGAAADVDVVLEIARAAFIPRFASASCPTSWKPSAFAFGEVGCADSGRAASAAGGRDAVAVVADAPRAAVTDRAIKLAASDLRIRGPSTRGDEPMGLTRRVEVTASLTLSHALENDTSISM